MSIKSYWEINASEDETDEIQATEKLDELLNNAVSAQMLSDVPIGLLLSGD